MSEELMARIYRSTPQLTSKDLEEKKEMLDKQSFITSLQKGGLGSTEGDEPIASTNLCYPEKNEIELQGSLGSKLYWN